MLEDRLVRCHSCGRTTSYQEDPAPMCPRCGGFQAILPRAPSAWWDAGQDSA